MSCLISLPDEVLKVVLQHVPLKDRLSSCCLVNKRLQAAAVAATEQLLVFPADPAWVDRLLIIEEFKDASPDQQLSMAPENAGSFLVWLSHYGQHITALCMLGFPQPLQQLPCPNLELLCLEDCSLQLGPTSDGQPGVIQGCTRLTTLKLRCTLHEAGAVVDSLSSLVYLEQLSVLPIDLERVENSIAGLSTPTLPCLQHLTSLNVMSLNSENLLQLEGLTKLRSLQLDFGDTNVGPSSTPALVLPTGLTRLVLWSPVEAGILSLVPTGLQELVVCGEVQGPAEGPTLLLSGIDRLQHLTKLVLQPVHDLDWPAPGPVYSGLTASSNLEFLECYDISPPAGAWPYVFPAARTLPHLTSFEYSVDMTKMDEPDEGSVGPPSAWGLADLLCLVSCCPNLCVIDGILMQLGMHVSELSRLTSLTKLCVQYASGDSDSACQSLQGLVALTRLQRLTITLDPWSGVQQFRSSLLPLTTLTALTAFVLTEVDTDPECSIKQEGPVPDVWLQLLEDCAAEDPSCQPTALRGLAQQLAEQRALAEQQLSAQQQQIAGLQEQLATQQRVAAERVAGLQRQLAEQQQVAAGQVAGLQGQLQALHVQLQELMQRL